MGIRIISLSGAIPRADTFAALLSSLIGKKDFGLPQNTKKGGLCMSGMYEMTPVRLSWRRTYVNFTDAMADTMIVHSVTSRNYTRRSRLHMGPWRPPTFSARVCDSAAAVKAAGKPVQVIEAANYHHLEMAELLGTPYGPNGRAALALMKLAPV